MSTEAEDLKQPTHTGLYVKGQWPSGVSGNPGGYSKEKRAAVARVADLAREYTPEAIQTLATIMKDEKATRTTRIAAANALLDRAHGKPPQSVGIALAPDDDQPEISDIEAARVLAFVLAKGAHAAEQAKRIAPMPINEERASDEQDR